MRKITAIKKIILPFFFVAFTTACNSNQFNINKAIWKEATPHISYTIKDSVSIAKGDPGKLQIEFYGWYKKGTVVSAFSVDEMNNFIELIDSQLTYNPTFKQLAKKSNGYIKFDIDKYMSTQNVFENGLPVFSFSIK
jgi:hypothetical protein